MASGVIVGARRAVLFFAGVAGAVAGCAAFGGDETPVTEVRDASDGDRTASEAAAGQMDGAAPPTGFCATLNPAPTFCSSFDDGLLPGAWDSQEATGLATLGLDDTLAHSRPAALVVTVPPTGGGSAGAFLTKTVNVLPRRVTTRLFMRLEKGGSGSGYDAIVIGLAADLSIELQLRPTGTGLVNVRTIDDGGIANSDTELIKPFPFGDWVEVSIVIDFAATASVTVNFNGVIACIVSNADPLGRTKFATLFVGDRFVGGSTVEWRVHYDDITFNVEKR